jgi:hypothetical protein
MSEDIRKMINKVKNFKQFVNENNKQTKYIPTDILWNKNKETGWYVDGILYLGHDRPQYVVDFRWFRDRLSYLWVHCKNVDAVSFFNSVNYDVNYFWHQEDTLTLTSKKYMWVYPGKQPIKNSISVLPEINNDDISECIGVCSDYIINYKK